MVMRDYVYPDKYKRSAPDSICTRMLPNGRATHCLMFLYFLSSFQACGRGGHPIFVGRGRLQRALPRHGGQNSDRAFHPRTLVNFVHGGQPRHWWTSRSS